MSPYKNIISKYLTNLKSNDAINDPKRFEHELLDKSSVIFTDKIKDMDQSIDPIIKEHPLDLNKMTYILAKDLEFLEDSRSKMPEIIHDLNVRRKLYDSNISKEKSGLVNSDNTHLIKGVAVKFFKEHTETDIGIRYRSKRQLGYLDNGDHDILDDNNLPPIPLTVSDKDWDTFVLAKKIVKKINNIKSNKHSNKILPGI
jgi:hypothetical protein